MAESRDPAFGRRSDELGLGNSRDRKIQAVGAAAGRVLYAAVFIGVLPLFLYLWAQALDRYLSLPPAIHSLQGGVTVTAAGLLLMMCGMWALWRKGGGLPMNAFPPPRLVTSGVYGLLAHPIYVGFAATCTGVAITFGSAAGLWIIAPTVILGSFALVLGFELPDLCARFGSALMPLRLLPNDDNQLLTVLDRTRFYLVVILPWLLLYEGILALGLPPDATTSYFLFESRIPILPFTESLYASTYLVVLLIPFLLHTQRQLRAFTVRALAAMLFMIPLYLIIPLVCPPRPLTGSGFWISLMQVERLADGAAAAFPSYHVVWALLCAHALSSNRKSRLWWRVWALLVALSCLTTGMHSALDVVAGFLAAQFAIHIDGIWEGLRWTSERIANSWREWRLGRLRIVNHGLYAALAAFTGAWILSAITGPSHPLIPIAVCLGSLLGAAVWAQTIEGSPSLLRPLGFYGGVLGAIACGAFAAFVTGTSTWTVFVGLAVIAPWVQGIGRLRCLVQGCCHGRPVSEKVGIRYMHPRSRVCRIAHLCGVPLHATPLYSILWNILVGILVVRLYTLHVRAAFTCGVYLVLSGLGRFAEEAYRGEPQTPILFGLRLYQWIALATAMFGGWVTTWPSPSALAMSPLLKPHLGSLAAAGLCGLVGWFVTGVDFPDSTRRYARLT
jgi:protein-S-isoprenylcysteine O-methyltransferase Ste14